MNLSKINWKTALLTIWVIFSFLYISYNMYSNFKNVILQNAFIAGQTDTVNRLLEQAMNKECKPFNVYSGDKKADLINIECLQKAAAPADSGVPGSGVQKK